VVHINLLQRCQTEEFEKIAIVPQYAIAT